MELIDFIVIGIVALIIGGAAAYIIKAKKSGKKCIGCPDGCSCNKGSGNTCNCCSGCHTESDDRHGSSN